MLMKIPSITRRAFNHADEQASGGTGRIVVPAKADQNHATGGLCLLSLAVRSGAKKIEKSSSVGLEVLLAAYPAKERALHNSCRFLGSSRRRRQSWRRRRLNK